MVADDPQSAAVPGERAVAAHPEEDEVITAVEERVGVQVADGEPWPSVGGVSQ
ncbi:hypothetical protein [Streptomyces sulphureus]|uniref:hypothetical protein n=1 Tax=Streptomyces sulphureus TaxID=47758 RepID=UPI00035C3DF0|nr:hypothetical protein [Streptomyces sulphureus]